MAESAEPLGTILEKVRSAKRRSSVGNNPFDTGKLPPQARELEEAVLGALMLDKNALTEVIDILTPESFYVDSHQLIFSAIKHLFSSTQPVDILTVTEEMRKRGQLEEVGGAYYVTELTNRVASAANVEFHSRIIMQKFVQRELIRISTDIIKDAYEDTTDVFELLHKAEKSIFEITDKNLKRNYSELSTLIASSIKTIEELKGKQNELTGVPSGFIELDRITSGWQKSDLIIVAARPGMGKTSFVLSLARNAAVDFKKPVAFFSLEMSNSQLAQRLISAETLLPAEKLRRGDLALHEMEQLTARIDTIADAPIYIDDSAAINMFELRAKCRRLVQTKGIQLVIIDYLQLMSGQSENRNGNREQEISNISRQLKGLAKELQIPIIALSQLSRAVETRGGEKKPQLSDLRESGAIEQDADMVMFIYRPEYYKLSHDAEGRPTSGVAEIIIAKNRHGQNKDVQVRFIDKYAKFVDVSPAELNDDFNSPPSSPFTQNPEGKIIVRGSKMNNMKDENDGLENPPF